MPGLAEGGMVANPGTGVGRKKGKYLRVIVVAVAVVLQCACEPRAQTPVVAPPANPPAITATMIKAVVQPTSTVAGTMVTPSAVPSPTRTPVDVRALTADAVRKLREAKSYEFKIVATHSFTFEGKTEVYQYAGDGAVAGPDRYRMQLRGPADVTLLAVFVGADAYCADTRGRLPTCSKAWGGPVAGSSPYTVIAYLMQFGQVEQAVAAVDDDGQCHVRFTPDLGKVAALDDQHAKALGNVTKVQGDLWIDRASGMPRREKAVVNVVGRSGNEETVDMSIEFSNFDRPVQIEMPSAERG